MINRLIYGVHRVLGMLLSLFFLMWFLTGIVMIYHGFPSASNAEKMQTMDVLQAGLQSFDSIQKRALQPDSISSMAVYSYLGRTYYEVGQNAGIEKLAADGLPLPEIDGDYIRSAAAKWCDAPVNRIDTLHQLEQWIPFGSRKNDLPIYKFHFADQDKTQVYVSSKTGNVLQCTTETERFWGWLSAVPHWVYFTWLRQDVVLWRKAIVWIGVFGMFMLVAGFYIGIRNYRLQLKRGKGLTSPYKKKWYKWHHVFGTLFGLFAFTWVLSGVYSLEDVPAWLGRVKKEYSPRKTLSQGMLKADAYQLDYRDVIATYSGQALRVDWSSFHDIPLYQVYLKGKDNPIIIDASHSERAEELDLTKQQVEKAVKAVHDNEPLQVELMTEYDNYYVDTEGKMVLPVWKVKVENADHMVYYVNPKTAGYRSYNTHGRWQFQLYQGFHCLKYKVFVGHPVIWTIVMWLLLLGGAGVSLTGVVMGVNYLRRTFRRISK